MSVCFHRLAAPGQLVLFAMGGTAYLALEIAWRGTTHWTMFLAGGACLCALDALGRLPLPTPLLAGIGAVGVSVLELGTGLACRRLLHVEVWDYSQEWGNLAGLVCPKYTALWFLLCLWVLGMMRFLRGFAAYVARTKALSTLYHPAFSSARTGSPVYRPGCLL